MLTPDEIGRAGERWAVSFLQSQGFRVNWNTRLPGSTDIEARNGKLVLVQVKTALYPAEPPQLSNEELRNIKARAIRSGAEAYIARLQVNASLALVGEIKWIKL